MTEAEMERIAEIAAQKVWTYQLTNLTVDPAKNGGRLTCSTAPTVTQTRRPNHEHPARCR